MQLDFNFIKKIFSKKPVAQTLQSAFLLGGTPYYTNNSNQLYDISLARACIHTIATHSAKLQPKFFYKGEFQEKSSLQYLLGNRPNPYMSSFDFIYKIVSMLYTSNNAFIYIHTDDYGDVDGLYPIPYKNVSLLEAKGSYYVKFICNNAEIVRPYEEVIHLRRHFNTNDFMGDNQTRVLEPTLKLNDSVIESIVNGVKSSNRLQGLLKASTLVQETELKKKKDEFVENYLSLDNAGGIAILDNKYDFQQIKLEPVLIDEKQMEAVANDLLRYYGVSENIIKSEYTENEYGAFYNSVIETLAIQISQELTNKIFSKRDIREGAKIVLSAERMTFASLDTRVKAIETLMPLGIFSINESRKVMELSDIENGDKHLVSLNYVDLDKANKYQVGETEDDKE